MVLTVQHFPLTFTLYSFEYQVGEGEGGGGTWVKFCSVCAASQSPYPIIVYTVASYRPHLSHFWANM